MTKLLKTLPIDFLYLFPEDFLTKIIGLFIEIELFSKNTRGAIELKLSG